MTERTKQIVEEIESSVATNEYSCDRILNFLLEAACIWTVADIWLNEYNKEVRGKETCRRYPKAVFAAQATRCQEVIDGGIVFVEEMLKSNEAGYLEKRRWDTLLHLLKPVNTKESTSCAKEIGPKQPTTRPS